MNSNFGTFRGGAVVGRRMPSFGLNAAPDSVRRRFAVAAMRPRVTSPSLAVLLAYFGAHAVLGIVMKHLPAVATIHALLSLLVALCWAALSKDPGKFIPAICYLAASELVWRMNNAAVFWEFGKYAICVVALVSLLRCRPPQFNGLALLYFGLLLPGILVTLLAGTGFETLRQILSFNLSGPFALAVCAFCFAGQRLQAKETDRCLLALLGPMVSAAAICLSGTVNLGSDYEFGHASNFDTSGGYGPNQVSSVFGLGMLVGFLWLQRLPRLSGRWWFALGLVLALAGEATLTFSRTGMWIGVITICVAAAFLLRESGRLRAGLIVGFFLLGFIYLFVFNSLDQFTGGMLSERYAEKGFTRREDIAQGDLELAWRNPFLGVGLGRAPIVRQREFDVHGAAHTEFTRMLAEHGLLGLLALAALMLMAAKSLKSAPTAWQQAWTASLIAYCLLFMAVTGMRLAVPSLAMGLAMVRILSADKAVRQNRPRGIVISQRRRLNPASGSIFKGTFLKEIKG